MLDIRPWADPVIDAVGHDPRSHYVEEFWLSILGPSTVWLLRRMAAGLEANPGGVTQPRPRTHYFEEFWLSILGPSTVWLLRRMAAGLETNPGGFAMTLADTAKALGLGDKGGRHSPFMRALGRVCQFDLGQLQDEGTLAVR